MTDQIDESIKHVEVAALGATFSPEARARIIDFLNSFVSFKPALGLLYGAVSQDGSGKGSWSITAFGPQTVAEMVEMYAGFGSVVRYELDGITVVIPQLAHIGELESGILEFVKDRISPVAQEEA
jgi:hypothetical protein